MIIIDEWKLLSEIYGQKQDIDKMNMWMNIWYKKYSHELLYVVYSKRFKKNKESKPFESDYQKSAFIARKNFIEKKIKNEDITSVNINQDYRIKEFAYKASDITKVVSTDPRFLVLWNYNPNIQMEIMIFGKWKLFFNNFDDFTREYKFKIDSKDDWILLLSLFPINSLDGKIAILPELPSFGQVKFEKIMKDFSVSNIEQILKINKQTISERQTTIVENYIVREIA